MKLSTPTFDVERHTRTWEDDELEAALQDCRDKFVPPHPCYEPVYMAARQRYAELLNAKRKCPDADDIDYLAITRQLS